MLAVCGVAACAGPPAPSSLGPDLAERMGQAQTALEAARPATSPPPAKAPRRPRVQVAAIRPIPMPPSTDAGAARPPLLLLEARQLTGATPVMLSELLGEPALQRTEGDAQAWLYAGRACALDLFLYADASGTRRVVHATARSLGSGPRVTEADCMQDLLGRPPLQES